MNAPAQIFVALAVAGAAAFLPLSSRFQEAAGLKQSAEKKAAAAAPGGAENSGTVKKKTEGGSVEDKDSGGPPPISATIPGGMSAADASRFIAELAAMDGKMLSTRETVTLLGKILELPASHLPEAQQVIQSMKSPMISMFLASGLFARWGEVDPEAAKASLEEKGTANPMLRMVGMASLAGGWLERDPDAFIGWMQADASGLNAQEKEMRERMMEGVMSGMVPLDPATAERLIAAAPKNRRPWMILDQAERDPDSDPRAAGLRALEEAGEDPGQRGRIAGRVARMLADRDPKDALAYAAEQDPKHRGGAYEEAVFGWAAEDGEAATKWLQSQPAEIQKQAVGGLRHEMRDMSYDETAKLAGSMDPGAGQKVWQMAMDQTVHRDPAEAVRYLPNVADEQRPGGYERIARQWTEKDPQAASEWIYDLAPGKEKDHAIQGMVGELRGKEPDSSTIWASTIGDESTRNNLVTENARTWLKRDRAAAEEWITATDTIPEEQKAQLLQPR